MGLTLISLAEYCCVQIYAPPSRVEGGNTHNLCTNWQTNRTTAFTYAGCQKRSLMFWMWNNDRASTKRINRDLTLYGILGQRGIACVHVRTPLCSFTLLITKVSCGCGLWLQPLQSNRTYTSSFFPVQTSSLRIVVVVVGGGVDLRITTHHLLLGLQRFSKWSPPQLSPKTLTLKFHDATTF